MADNKNLEKSTGSLFDSNWEPSNPDKNLGSTSSDELVTKRLSVWAVSSVALGVLSILAFVKVGFMAISVVGALFGIFAFITIRLAGGEVSGKWLACLGLALCLATAVGGPVRAYAYRVAFEKQADEFCRFWFQQVQAGEVEIARTLTDSYWSRPPMINDKDKLGYWFRVKGNQGHDEEKHNELHAYLSSPTLLTIAHFGDKAKISLYEVIGTTITESKERTSLCYAITCPAQKEGDKPQTFLIRLSVERQRAKTEEGERLCGLNLAVADPQPLKLLPDGRPNYDD